MQSCAFLPLPSSSPREHAGAGLQLMRDPQIYVRRTFWAGPKEQPVQRPEGRSLPGVLERRQAGAATQGGRDSLREATGARAQRTLQTLVRLGLFPL